MGHRTICKGYTLGRERSRYSPKAGTSPRVHWCKHADRGQTAQIRHLFACRSISLVFAAVDVSVEENKQCERNPPYLPPAFLGLRATGPHIQSGSAHSGISAHIRSGLDFRHDLDVNRRRHPWGGDMRNPKLLVFLGVVLSAYDRSRCNRKWIAR